MKTKRELDLETEERIQYERIVQHLLFFGSSGPVAGDPTLLTIRSEGWSADLTFKGMTTGGTYDFGLGPNNEPLDGDPKVVISVRSSGFSDTGTATTIDRTVYGTKQVRKVYPDQASNDETVSGSDVVIRIALDEYIYSSDTILSVTVLSDLYNDGLLTSRSRTVTSVNSSTAAYQRVIGNWSWPGWQRLDASSKLRATVFHRHGQQGRPVRAVKFTVTDGTTTVTETVTAPTYDSSVGDAVPVVEYVTTTNLTAGLTQGAVLTANFVAYPWVGDTPLDTGDGVNSNATTPTPLYAPQLHVCDSAGTYASSVAVVDPAAGNDGTGAVATSLATAETTPYLTMAAAFNALRTYNNTNYSRNNCGGSVMYLRTGNNAFVNGSVTLGTTPDTYLTVTRHPNDARSGVFITNQVTGKSLGLRLRVYDVNISATNAAGTISPGGNSALWIDYCTLSAASGIPIYQNRVWSITRCSITGQAQWFDGNSTEDWRPALIRGNTLTFTTGTCNIRSWCLIGNTKTGNTTAGTFAIVRTRSGSAAPICDNGIVAYNRLYGLNNNINATIAWAVDTPINHGQAIVQNVFENYKSAPSPLVQIAADGAAVATTNPNNNIIIWQNTFIGQRQNLAYNDNGSDAPVRLYWSVKNNIHWDDNIKSDTFPTANAARVNNWSQLYGVGWSGNVLGKNGTAFLHEFSGLKSVSSNWSAGSPAVYFNFTSYAAYNASVDGAGGGDYTLTVSSPARNMQRDLLIPYDVAGTSRGSTNASGAFVQ